MNKREAIISMVEIADRLETNGNAEQIDALRGALYDLQIAELQSAIGRRVRVVSEGWGVPPTMKFDSEGDCTLNPGFIISGGAQTTCEGKLIDVKPLLYILVADDDGTGKHGLPFLGASSICEVADAATGEVIFLNPKVTPGFYEIYRRTDHNGMFQIERHMFGSTERQPGMNLPAEKNEKDAGGHD